MKPNVGMVYPVACKIKSHTVGNAITYDTTGMVVAEARGATIQWEKADGSFYGDDVLLDTDNSILGYTIDFEPAGLKSAARAYLLGETVSSETYEVTNAGAPDVGFGYIRVMKEDGTGGKTNVTYEGWWFHKLKFSIASEETRTKERNTEWRVPTLNGKGEGVSVDDTGVLKFAEHKDFTTLATAKTWLKGKANIK